MPVKRSDPGLEIAFLCAPAVTTEVKVLEGTVVDIVELPVEVNVAGGVVTGEVTDTEPVPGEDATSEDDVVNTVDEPVVADDSDETEGIDTALVTVAGSEPGTVVPPPVDET
ncbi:hypothetical protein RRF57_000613 [Xylaria bambusicola]|uniref:Uncharacterized protein n=1 Tax=Xylaria bambusicola TaxID=326684 RepID=A0AAN7UCJ3_9PEZI